jgi:hypothetical protein
MGGGLFNAPGATARFQGSKTSTTVTVATFSANQAIGGRGGLANHGGLGKNEPAGATNFGGGGQGGFGQGGSGGAGGTGGSGEGGGFYNAGSASFTTIALNLTSNQAIGSRGTPGGNGGSGIGSNGGLALEGGSGGPAGNALGGNGGNGGAGGNALGGGALNASTGTLVIAPRLGAKKGSKQSKSTSTITDNQAIGGPDGNGGLGGPAVAGSSGAPNPHPGSATPGLAGRPGTPSEGIGGGLNLVAGGHVTLDNTTVATNSASTSNPDIFGTFSQ